VATVVDLRARREDDLEVVGAERAGRRLHLAERHGHVVRGGTRVEPHRVALRDEAVLERRVPRAVEQRRRRGALAEGVAYELVARA